MCDRLADLREALTAFSARLDPDALPTAEAAQVVGQATAIEAAAAALKARAAARAAQSTEWRSQGFRSPAEALARQTGVAVGIARQTLETGRRLQATPVLARIAGSGRLSAAQTTLIAEAVDLIPDAADRLIDHAQQSSLADLRNEVARTKATAAPPDLEARRQAIHARRRLRSWTDPEGTWHLHAIGNPEDVQDLMARGDPFVAAILTRGQTLVGVAHLGRRPTAAQQSALQWLYPSGAAEGCPVQARLQYDHRVDWAKTHYTMLDQLDALCAHHHALKTRCNWALVVGHGKRPFVPPDDPRHPARSAGPGPRASSPARATGPPARPSRPSQSRRPGRQLGRSSGRQPSASPVPVGAPSVTRPSDHNRHGNPSDDA